MIPTSCASNFISGVNGAPIRFSPRSMGDTAVEEGQSSKIWTGNQSTDDILGAKFLIRTSNTSKQLIPGHLGLEVCYAMNPLGI
ncbi:hypothetical protein [Brucella sp.]|uniref:hypothetical protein n=1 Tax=Brucella TaxID=234 RepID=UPI0028B13CDD|nr:hypothetical protein [Brucella sp.]